MRTIHTREQPFKVLSADDRYRLILDIVSETVKFGRKQKKFALLSVLICFTSLRNILSRRNFGPGYRTICTHFYTLIYGWILQRWAIPFSCPAITYFNYIITEHVTRTLINAIPEWSSDGLFIVSLVPIVLCVFIFNSQKRRLEKT